MKLRQGFTLIELLIVVTIIAILAGAAIPYVQDYVEQSRIGRAKADMDEIRKAVMAYEVQYGAYGNKTAEVGIASLVGPFLTKNTPDPWGGAYKVHAGSSTVYTYGPDGIPNTGDELSVEFRPRMAVTKAYYIDANGNDELDAGDALQLKFCRPASFTAPSSVNLKIVNNTGVADGSTISANGEWLNETTASFTLTPSANFKVASCGLKISLPNNLSDWSQTAASAARADIVKIIYQ